ncbi:hypothetical protein [Paenibacillus agricola]|uniref:Uncharacterized protein n=1 Tax=Paenibacillus agricola TaxID=2716264 RepID=A0ABX0J5R8_9BACL|nr:hypothetical protein [Paenibacillus agricola]NHN30177.1 hypothetical protein [Paenibacillus agricola]
MDPIDDELKKGMVSGPLIQHGFSDQLKKRIEQRVGEGKDKSNSKWMLWFSGISTALIAVTVLITVNWQQLNGMVASQPYLDKQASYEQAEPLATVTLQSMPIRSAVLIGLREDHPAISNSSPYSTYRTLLLAAEKGEFRSIADGEGILMPYKSEFIKIITQSQTSVNEESRTLHAAVATGRGAEGALQLQQEEAPPAKPLKNAEKLLFAGNRYLALSQTIRQRDQGEANQSEYVWVKELDDLPALTKLPKADSLMPTRDPHLSLRKLYGDSINPTLKAKPLKAPQDPGFHTAAGVLEQADENGESWTISRRQGKWVAQMASYNVQPEKGAYRFQLEDMPLALPEAVVAYDQLAADWDDIRKLRPNAIDAFSSPNRELVGVVSDTDIKVYPFQDKLIAEPLLSLQLAPNESVVMIQWATQEPYIEQWKQKGRLLLGE